MLEANIYPVGHWHLSRCREFESQAAEVRIPPLTSDFEGARNMRALPQMPLCGPWAVDRPGVRARAAGRRSRTASYSLRQTLGPRRLGVARHTLPEWESGLPKRMGVRTLDLAEI